MTDLELLPLPCRHLIEAPTGTRFETTCPYCGRTWTWVRRPGHTLECVEVTTR